jgi:inner membrane protein
MTGRTHDLAAFTALNLVIVSQPLHHFSLATGLCAFTANMIGGLAPDIDQPTAALWNRLPAGSIIGRLLTPILGGHRFISHSLLGIFLFGWGLKFVLNLASSVVLVDMTIVWWAFMIGFVSHLLVDTLTRDGVPWLFPIPIHIGIPPLRALRFKTGGLVEKSIIFPGLMILNVYLVYNNYSVFLDFIKNYIQ